MLERIRAVPLNRVRVTDDFWQARQRLIAETAVPYMEKILRDEIPGAEKSHAIENFRIAAGDAEGEFYGMVFQDTDVAKWLETAAYSLLTRSDAELEARMDELIDVIARAQSPDGYLNTYFTLVEPEKRWTNLLECHELYTAGHMIEAGVAYYEAVGKTNLLNAVRKLADAIVERFSEDGIPGHQEIEIALLRLYRVTGEAKYRDMALAFLNRRGQDPAYFKKNTPAHPGVHYGGYDIDPNDTDYNQSYAPVREQTDARGHAVRCLYMLTAMADAADATGDESLKSACERMLNNIVERRMYVTGGLGARAHHESFGGDWELPNDTAYNETCASVAMALFMRRMLNLEPDGRYADLLELELYNGALAGMQLDGTRYFYVNPLEVTPGISGVQLGYEHVLPTRPKWHACACCPPNLSRLIASLGGYLWSESEDAVWSHLFVGSVAETALARITLDCGYPWRGGAKYTVEPKMQDTPFSLMIHAPAYLEDVAVTLNGETILSETTRGYLKIERKWKSGDVIELAFDLQPRRLYADPRVTADAGCVAVARGPLIYCVEGVDHAKKIGDLRIPKTSAIRARDYEPNLLGGVVSLAAEGSTEDGNAAILNMIPYYAWGNRGENEMRVWIRETL